MWRALFRTLGRFGRRGGRQDLARVDPWGSADRALRPSSALLDRIEGLALDVYVAHGLPTTPGHYRWSGRSQTWTFLGEHMTPEARWQMLLERPPEAGWRYATLVELGRTGPPDVAAAAGVLDSCARLRRRSTNPAAEPWQEMELAIHLGAQWHALERRRVAASAPRLRLTAPNDGGPGDEPPKRTSPRRARRED